VKEERTTSLRERMIEDMRIRGMAEKTQQAHIRGVKDFAAFLGRSPDTATPEELRAYQLHMTDVRRQIVWASERDCHQEGLAHLV
jgi:hypothetical protein